MTGTAKRVARRLVNAALLTPGLHGLARRAARLGLVPERVYAGVPLDRVAVLRLHGARIRYHVRTGDYVGMPLYWAGAAAYEPETFEFLRDRLARAKVFFDVGANTGIYSLFAAACCPGIEVHAFEPNPDSFAQLGRNTALNDLEGRVTAWQLAIGETDGTTEFDVPQGVFATSAALATGTGPAAGTRRIVAAASTLDRICETAPLPDVVKLDVEGFEDRALGGMQGVLAAARPDLIVEVLDDAPRAAIERLLVPHGYRFGQLTRTGVVWRDRLGAGPAAAGRNWLCSAAGTAATGRPSAPD